MAGRVRANQMRAFFGANTLMTMATAMIAVVLAVMFKSNEPYLVVGWLAAMAWFIASQVRIMVRPGTREPRRTVSPRGPAVTERAAIMLGLVWGAVPLLFGRAADPEQLFILGLIASGTMCSGAFVLATTPRAAILFVALIAVQGALALPAGPAVDVLLALLMLATFAAIVSRCAIAFGRQAAQHIVDQQLISEAAAEQKRLRDAMRVREARAQALIELQQGPAVRAAQ